MYNISKQKYNISEFLQEFTMELSDLNPHIRYARIHKNALGIKSVTSICYDCRLFFFQNITGSIVINEETHVSAIDLALGSKKAYEAEEETTMDIFGYLQDITIPDIEIPSYNIDGILRPDRYYPQTEPHSGESDESTTADTVSEEYETEPTAYY
jgi:hypothetical protein